MWSVIEFLSEDNIYFFIKFARISVLRKYKKDFRFF